MAEEIKQIIDYESFDDNYNNRMKLLRDVQDRTLQAIYEKFNTIGKAVCIRPTGFGKTFTVGTLLRTKDEDTGLPLYRNVGFVCPSESIKSQIKGEILYEGDAVIDDDGTVIMPKREKLRCRIFDNGKFKYASEINIPKKIGDNDDDVVNVFLTTYMMMSRQVGSDVNVEKILKVFGGQGLDLLVMDEFHHAGADKARFALCTAVEQLVSAHVIGLTATYDRSDDIDPALEIFGKTVSDNVFIYRYDYTNAVLDGILPCIKYYCCDYIKWKDAVKRAEKAEQDADDLTELLFAGTEYGKLRERARGIKAKLLSGMSEKIVEMTQTAIGGKYMDKMQKWLIYYPNYKRLDEDYEFVIDWFKRAYPDREIRPVKVTIRTKDNENQNLNEVVTKLKTTYNPPFDEKVIVLIFSVGQLLEGVHLENVTACMIFTDTQSGIKYNQILGRVIDSQRKTRPFIVDMMSAYELMLTKITNDKLEAYKYYAAKDGCAYGNVDDVGFFEEMEKKMNTKEFNENLAKQRAEAKRNEDAAAAKRKENAKNNKKNTEDYVFNDDGTLSIVDEAERRNMDNVLHEETMSQQACFAPVITGLAEEMVLNSLSHCELYSITKSIIKQLVGQPKAMMAACGAYKAKAEYFLKMAREMREKAIIQASMTIKKTEAAKMINEGTLKEDDVHETDMVDPLSDNEPYVSVTYDIDDDSLDAAIDLLEEETEKYKQWKKVSELANRLAREEEENK